MMTEELSSSETSVLTRTTRYNIPEDGILYVAYVITGLSQFLVKVTTWEAKVYKEE
jgi:hypothetical protein